MSTSTDVAVIGGGPVGLFLGCRLAQLGVGFVVLERHAAARSGSRALGIHAPSLERLAALGIVEPLCASGVVVKRGLVYSSRRRLGQVDLSRGRGSFSFVLAVPQERTEALLVERLERLCPGALIRGASVERVRGERDGGRVWIPSRAGSEPLRARAVVGCDGKHSVVRRDARIPLDGSGRPERYAMGDFADTTDYGADAAIFLADGGLVESFPLPSRRRRWVAQVDDATRAASPADLSRRVLARTGHELAPTTATAMTTFGVEQRRARAMASGRLVLAGDSAHLVSPFGGQGMNLGFLDAWDLAETLRRSLCEGLPLEPALRGYDRRRRLAARRVLRRAALNGFAGRRRAHPRPRNAAVAGMLAVTPQRLLCDLFTMRGLR